MKQLIQDLRNGKISIIDQPVPRNLNGHLLIRTCTSLISPGTEKMLIDFGRSNLLQKAISQPEKVKQVFDKVRSDGIVTTLHAIKSKMDDPLPLGYCNAGEVLECGPDVAGLRVGDRVVSNGHHAEIVCVPKNLCAVIPDNVSYEEACFTILAAIGLQGVRLLGPALGERIGLIGLGLVGLLAGQLLRASGCNVIGFDLNRQRLQLAESFGIVPVDLNSVHNPVEAGLEFSGGAGLDGVIIAAATDRNDPVSNAAFLCRQRGRIILIGVCGLELNREQFYKKELTFQVSCSYGPGRYDPGYEEQGHDYPIGFVRWTEQRNFQAVLETMSQRRIDVRPLITDRIPHERASYAYRRLSEPDSLGIVLQYPTDTHLSHRVEIAHSPAILQRAQQRLHRIGVIGAGSFARSTILPLLRDLGVVLMGVASQSGLSAALVAEKFGFRYSTSQAEEILSDPETNIVFIATQHNTHSSLIVSALSAGKHVFVEKPLCINEQQLREVEEAYEELAIPRGLRLMIGFNRRFSVLTQKLHRVLAGVPPPLSLVFTVNAGLVPESHWTRDPQIGGGRIIGEGCHFIDLVSFLSRSPVTAVQASTVGDRDDEMTIVLRMQNGSIGTVHYFSSGQRSFPKETLQVFSHRIVLVLENFRTLRGFGVRGFRYKRLWKQDKGHRREVELFLECIRQGTASPVSFASMKNTTLASFAAVGSARSEKLEKVS